MNEWISVKDRLPEIPDAEVSEWAGDYGRGFLTVDTDGYVEITTFWKEENEFENHEDIIYWMPLPKPPKESKNEM